MTWATRADAVIQQVHDQLAADADLATRKRELRKAAGLFHGGTSWGKKVWAARSRAYLARHGQTLPRGRSPRLLAAMASGDIIFPFRAQPK
jgi:hypothetical protein